jgi:hypothetical protein
MQMENTLSNLPNQSLTRQDVKKYSNSTDNTNVVTSNPEFKAATTLPSNQTDIRTFLIQKTGDENTNSSYLTTNTQEMQGENEGEPSDSEKELNENLKEVGSYSDKDIVEEEEEEDANITIETDYNKVMREFYDNEVFKQQFKNNYKLNKKGEYIKQKSLENKTLTDEEKKSFYDMLNHFNINAAKNITTKSTAYKILLDNFNIQPVSESKIKSDTIFEE